MKEQQCMHMDMDMDMYMQYLFIDYFLTSANRERRLSYERRLPYQVFYPSLLLETLCIITVKYASICKRCSIP